MSDLVAFLNARLDEDERSLTGLAAGTFEHALASTLVDLAPVQARALREVEAERKILDRCARVLDAFGDEHGEWPDVTRRERAHADFVLCELAAVYSDHPDYQQDWA